MKKILIFIMIAFYSIANVFAVDANIKKKVFINQFVKHPALDATTKGIVDGLEQNGYKQGVNLEIRIESAQANAVLAYQIATKFANQNLDVVVGVATVSAQSFRKYTKEKKIKLVFSSVTDPIEAGLVQNLKNPGGNISGVSNFVKLEPQIKLFKEIQPNLKRLGLIYNPSEINSLSVINKLKELSTEFDIILVLQAVTRTSDVAQAVSKLVNNVDAIFISNDNTALSALQTIINISNKSKIPVYVSDTDAVKLGALAALGPNQYQVGLQTAKIITRILDGENPGDIAIESPNDTELYLNEDVANKMKISFPKDVKNKATKIIGKNDIR